MYRHILGHALTMLCVRPPHPPSADLLTDRSYDKLCLGFDNFTVTVKTSEKRKVKRCRSLTWRGVFLNNTLMAFPSRCIVSCGHQGMSWDQLPWKRMLWAQGQCSQTPKKLN